MKKYFPDYNLQISSSDMFTAPEDLLCNTDHTCHGTAIMWHTSLDSCISRLTTTNTRFTAIKINIQAQRFLVISAYFPTSGKDEEYLETCSDIINFVAKNQQERGSDTILIGADSNCSDKSSKRRKQALTALCDELCIERISPRVSTFHHHNGSSDSNIDCFLLSTSFSPKLSTIHSICTLDTPDNLSSHDPVHAALQLPLQQINDKTSKYDQSYSDFNHKKIVWTKNNLVKFQELAAMALTKYEKLFSLPEHIPLKCDLFSRLLVKAAEMSMDVKSDKKRLKFRSKPSPALHQAWLKLRKYFNAWKWQGKPRDDESKSFKEYKQSRGVFQRIYRYENELKLIRNNNKIMEADKSNKKEFFKIIKSIRSSRTSQHPNTLTTPAGDGTYHGTDTLEGFTADAELLGSNTGESETYDNEFYKLCILENCYIFDLKDSEAIRIPIMKISDLENILNREMKLNKACDIYQLTVEHLRYSGAKAKLIILGLINDIICNINYLACPQVKLGLSTCAYKGKNKPITDANSYRRITVTPQIGCILDRYIDPIAEKVFLKVQSSDQLGFTQGLSYLMAAVERGECQRYAIDTKQTCFGVSFDGKAAFPSVNRDIQLRELHACGETGDLLDYSRNTYQNTASHIKQDGRLGRQFHEHKGNRQGHKRASGHFKCYINPCLITANSSNLGFWIGPICVSCICVADDTYVLSNNTRKLQGLIDIVGHYSKRYQLVFGASKTKVTITGSTKDMDYYKDINIWSLHGDPLQVADDNDHLGLIISGKNEEQKNVDKNIDSARRSLFSLLGNIFSYKCKVSPTVLSHVWSIFVSPVLRSGLAALPIRPVTMKILANFHHKVLRGILKLGRWSPIVPLYFLLGEAPIEAYVHMDIFALFWNIWSNPQTKTNEIVKYLLKMTDSTSVTWTAHIKILFSLYRLPDPLDLINSPTWPKQRWKELTHTRVLSHHENVLRAKASDNYKLNFLNIQVVGLSGRPHPVLHGVITTQETVKSRVHLRMLAGDYPCQYYIGKDRNQDTACKMCKQLAQPHHHHHHVQPEDMTHLLTTCRATADIRSKLLPDLLNEVSRHFPSSLILTSSDNVLLTQFILDPTSINLPMNIRISPDHPSLSYILSRCRNYCFVVHKDRNRILRQKVNSVETNSY